MKRLLKSLLLCSSMLPCVLHAQNPDSVRAELSAALTRVEQRQAEPPDSEALRSHVLFPYLEAQRLRQLLVLSPISADGSIATFLQQHDDAIWTRDLRREWLASLATRGQWQRYLANYRENRADQNLRCHLLNATINTAVDAGLQAKAITQWLNGATLPPSCDAPFQWLRDHGALSADLIEQRARLALQAGNNGLAATLARELPPERAAPLQQWARLLADPRKELDALVSPLAVEAEALFGGFKKLARNDPDAAATVLQRLQSQCATPCALQTPATIDELRRELALGHAWSRQSAAVDEFRAVPEAIADDRVYEWRIRAALWSRDWPQALAWIKRLPPVLAQQPRWRYWLARSQAATGDNSAAKAGFESLTRENGFFSAAAAERLNRGFTPTPVAAPAADPLVQKQLAEMPNAIRARELFLLGRSDWAAIEWAELIRDLDKAGSIQAARLASSWGWHGQAVSSSTRAELFDDFALLYPRPFEAEVKIGAAFSGVAPEQIFAVLRQESLYDPRARSRADALGLMQLLPATAQSVAQRWQLPRPTREDLFDPQTNIRLGAAHLRELDDRFGRHILTLASYNAGQNAMKRWLPAQALDADIWIENIPYNETRSYIQRILWHGVVFGWERSGKPQRITELQAAVVPVAP